MQAHHPTVFAIHLFLHGSYSASTRNSQIHRQTALFAHRERSAKADRIKKSGATPLTSCCDLLYWHPVPCQAIFLFSVFLASCSVPASHPQPSSRTPPRNPRKSAPNFCKSPRIFCKFSNIIEEFLKEFEHFRVTHIPHPAHLSQVRQNLTIIPPTHATKSPPCAPAPSPNARKNRAAAGC